MKELEMGRRAPVAVVHQPRPALPQPMRRTLLLTAAWRLAWRVQPSATHPTGTRTWDTGIDRCRYVPCKYSGVLGTGWFICLCCGSILHRIMYPCKQARCCAPIAQIRRHAYWCKMSQAHAQAHMSVHRLRRSSLQARDQGTQQGLQNPQP